MDEARRQWLSAYNRAHRTGRQHRGPLTGRTLDVLDVLSEVEGPISYTDIAALVTAKHGRCSRSTVHEAIKALQAAGLLSWERRHGRVWRHKETPPRWRVLRLQNVYQVRFAGQ
jgi:DNA-binding IclR family transcriptional regulator